ncbi:MAG: hypothetical protein V4733_09690 [Verrucomicrobiota bacterium]
MYGVPSDLPLQQFIDATLDQICIGEHQLQLHFSTTVSAIDIQQGKFPEPRSVSVESAWELRDHSGEILDQWQEHSERDSYSIHQLLGRPVTAFRIDPPHSVTLIFDTGAALTIYDDSTHYESFSIQPGEIYV